MVCSRSRTPNASTFQAERAIAVRSPRVGQEVRPLCASPLRTARCQGAPSAAPHLLATASYVCMCLVALGSAHRLPALGCRPQPTAGLVSAQLQPPQPTPTRSTPPPSAAQLTSQGRVRDVRPRGRPPAYKAPPPRGNVSSSCALECTWQPFSALRCFFLACTLSHVPARLGKWAVLALSAVRCTTAMACPPPPPHLSHPRSRLHTTPPAQLAALGRACDGRSPGRPHSTGRRRHEEVCFAMCAACGALGATTVCWVHHTAVGHLGWQQSQGVGLTTPGACSGTFITTSPVCPLTPSCLPKELSASPPPKCQRPAHRASRHQTPRYRLWPRDCSHGAP